MVSSSHDLSPDITGDVLLFVPVIIGGHGARLAQNSAAATIQIPPGAPAVIRYAAREVSDAIGKMTGSSAAIVQANSAAPGYRIVLVPDTRLGSEEYDLRSDGRTVTIRGGMPRGVMYGCMSLLEDVYGCRWFNRRVSYFPKHRAVAVPPIHLHGKPAFEYREVSFNEAFDGAWALHNRMNGSSMALTDEMGGKVIYGRFVHTSDELVPPGTYFGAHPEYYALRDGKRNPDQLELTNPDVLRIATATVERWIAENPKATIFSVSQNDNWAQSQSPESQAINAKEGAPSGLFLRFVNAIAKVVARKHPNVLIDTLAYQWTEDPPKLTRPLPNVRVRIAPIGADFAHGLADSPQNRKPYANLQQWHKITRQLYIWHYCTDFANYLQPLPDLEEIPADIGLFQKSGVVGVFYEGDYAAGGGGEMGELKSYLIGRLLWDPKQSPSGIINEYCDHVYGAAAPYIKSWLAELHRPARTGVPATIYDPPTVGYLSDELLKRGTQLFDQAEAAVAGQPAADEVARARLALESVQLARTTPGGPLYKSLSERVAAKIHRFGITEVREGEPVSEYLKRIGQP